MTLLVQPGLLSAAQLRQAADRNNCTRISAILMASGTKDPDSFARHFPNAEIISLPGMINHGVPSMPCVPLHKQYDTVLRHILGDPRTVYLVERSWRKYGFLSVFNNIPAVEVGVWNTISVLGQLAVKAMVLQATPHRIDTWVFARVAELLGVFVCFTSHSVIEGRTEMLAGIDEQEPLLPRRLKSGGVHQATKDLLAAKRSNYEKGIPEYEKKRQFRYRNRFWNTRHEIATWFSGSWKVTPLRILESFRKARSLVQYNKLALPFLPQRPFIIFFPHYQPERTTLPEGGWYAHQWLAIRALSDAATMKGWEVVYKEHPSTFRQPWNSTFRDQSFFREVSRLGNVHIAPLSLDPFSLIDRSVASATLTGTSILESVARGKPVLAFGKHVPKGLLGVHVVDSLEAVHHAVHEIAGGAGMPDTESTERFLKVVQERTFARDKQVNTSLDAFAELLALASEKEFPSTACSITFPQNSSKTITL